MLNCIDFSGFFLADDTTRIDIASIEAMTAVCDTLRRKFTILETLKAYPDDFLRRTGVRPTFPLPSRH